MQDSINYYIYNNYTDFVFGFNTCIFFSLETLRNQTESN